MNKERMNKKESTQVLSPGRVLGRCVPYKSKRYEVIKNYLFLLSGLWGLGLGSRIAYELLKSGSGTYIMVPVHPVNIFFDFIPLALFGLAVVITVVYSEIKRIYSNNNKPF